MRNSGIVSAPAKERGKNNFPIFHVGVWGTVPRGNRLYGQPIGTQLPAGPGCNPDPPAGLSGRGKRFPYKSRALPFTLAARHPRLACPTGWEVSHDCSHRHLPTRQTSGPTLDLSQLARQAGKGADAD